MQHISFYLKKNHAQFIWEIECSFTTRSNWKDGGEKNISSSPPPSPSATKCIVKSQVYLGNGGRRSALMMGLENIQFRARKKRKKRRYHHLIVCPFLTPMSSQICTPKKFFLVSFFGRIFEHCFSHKIH